MHALTPESLSPERQAEIAAHLADCAACQGTHDFFAVSEGVLDAELRDETTWEPVIGSETKRKLMEYGALVAKEDREAEELLKPYLENPISVAWQALVTKRRFRTAGVVRGLTRAAHAMYDEDALVALTFADNAIAIANALDDERYPSSALDQLRATAWKERATRRYISVVSPTHISRWMPPNDSTGATRLTDWACRSLRLFVRACSMRRNTSTRQLL